MFRFRTLLLLIAAIAVSLWLWQRADPQHVATPDSPNFPSSTIGPTAAETDGRTPLPASTAADNLPTIAAPVASEPGGTASSAGPARTARSDSVRLDVNAPPAARVGNSVTVTIDAEAFGGIRNLSFVVVYDNRLLEFVSSSPGSLVQQASAPATLGAEDPSTAGVLVHMEIKNGGVVAGAGTVVVLEFNALQAGVAPITLRDVSFLESGRSSGSTTAAVRAASVAID
jgi:Cohesin domain